jgi:hypothetical protein
MGLHRPQVRRRSRSSSLAKLGSIASQLIDDARGAFASVGADYFKFVN